MTRSNFGHLVGARNDGGTRHFGNVGNDGNARGVPGFGGDDGGGMATDEMSAPTAVELQR